MKYFHIKNKKINFNKSKYTLIDSFENTNWHLCSGKQENAATNPDWPGFTNGHSDWNSFSNLPFI